MTNSNIETTKQLTLKEIDTAPEPAFLNEVLHYIRFLKEQYRLEDEIDQVEAKEALAEIDREGTTSIEQLKQELGQ